VARVIIIGGPNGAGKTTFASAYLSIDREITVFVNADEISRDLAASNLPAALRDIRAARAMLRRVDELVVAGTSFGAGVHIGLPYVRSKDSGMATGWLPRRVDLRTLGKSGPID
jgi:predicted ABC-type ATPase